MSEEKPRSLVVVRTDVSRVEVYLSPQQTKDLDARLARIEGHIRAVRRMLAEHEDCNALLIQLAAVRSALNQAIVKLLEGHIDSCVMECVTTPEGKASLASLKEALKVVLRHS